MWQSPSAVALCVASNQGLELVQLTFTYAEPSVTAAVAPGCGAAAAALLASGSVSEWKDTDLVSSLRLCSR